MKTTVKTSVNTYPIITGRGLSEKLRELLPFTAGRKIMVVCDDTVAELYLQKVISQFPDAYSYIFPHGENSKTLSVAEKIATNLAELKFTRRDFVFALGGGVTGDLAGFVSSIYMRGIPYVQLPTTLLAGIDSSVGGKTAVNIPFGKNLIGRIYPPQAVIFDLDALKTLPEIYVRDGIGEGLKYAILDGENTFSLMEKGYETDLEKFVDLCIGYKKRVVELDENENSLRRLLNLGHTLGHSVERKSGLSITHGVCVAIGLKLVVEASFKQGCLQKNDYERISALFNQYAVPDCPYKIEELLESVAVDKKTEGDTVNLVTVHGIGDCRITPVALDKLEEFF